MARNRGTIWTKELLAETYQANAELQLAERLIEVLNRVDALGRLLTKTRVGPAFGIVGNRGQRVLSIREHDGIAIHGRISLFPGPERYTAPSDYESLRECLGPIRDYKKPETEGSWDVASLDALSNEAYRQFLDVLDSLGPVPASDAQVDLPSPRVDLMISRIVRDSAMVRRLKQLYDNCCQICGEQVTGLYGWTYSEAHHVRPLGGPHGGQDDEDNLLILCPNHHAACDFGAVKLIPSKLHFELGHRVRPEHIDYHNKTILRQDR